MREPIFVDTGYIRALLETKDDHHEVAEAWRKKIKSERIPLVVSTAIFIELGDGFYRPQQWARLGPVIAGMRAHADTTVVTVGEDVFRRALALRSARADKAWGLTDCTSFVIMADWNIRSALSCDSDFQQAGFRALLIE